MIRRSRSPAWKKALLVAGGLLAAIFIGIILADSAEPYGTPDPA